MLCQLRQSSAAAQSPESIANGILYPKDVAGYEIFTHLSYQQVRAAAAGNSDGIGINYFHIAGQAPAKPGDPPPRLRLVTAGFFEAMGLPLIQGRAFHEEDAGKTPRAGLILSESAARHYWNSPGDPIGANATVKPYAFPVFTIIGVVGDTRDWFTGAPDPTIYVLNDHMPQWSMQLVVRTTANPAKALAAVQAQAQGGDRSQPVYDAKTMDQLFDEQLSGVRLSAWMMSVFAVIALVLAASGVYGVVSYLVARRTHEIGIRMALGAEAADVRRQVVMQAMKLASAGIVLGTLAALALTRIMSSLLYGVVALETGTFVGVVLLLAVSAITAGYIPARRASSIDPVIALRDECGEEIRCRHCRGPYALRTRQANAEEKKAFIRSLPSGITPVRHPS